MAKNAKATNALGMGLDPSVFTEAKQTETKRTTPPVKPQETHAAPEYRTKRMYLLVRPSVAERFVAAAKAQGSSANDLINTLMEEYLEKNEL